MRRSLGVGVSRVAVVNGTGQRVQLLQRYPESQPHVCGDQVSAGHAERTEKTQADFTLNNIISVKACSHPISSISNDVGNDQKVL